GGSWSEYFLAHESQLVRVPANVNDENALMLEPFATSLHAVLQNLPRDDETVLILGAGVIGLCALAALRAVGSRARIIVMARHAVQQEMARAYGADIVIATSGNDYYAEFARAVGGELRQPIIGKRVLVGGGAEIVFECVGNSGTIDDALRCVRARGRVVMLGLAALPSGVDWTPIWLRELNVIGTYTYGVDEFRGERARTFDLALDLIKQGKVNLAPLVTHKFALKDYARAFETIRARGKNRALKVAFEFA
ncbi:MAG: zinc-binding dehydrogenase, partial [Chloroflexi bacterium]|nr:zinc-binding dehydrogenase [Chloroflexota bacterium]